MSESGGSNIEIAHHLSEHKESSQSLGHEIWEIFEALVLAVVAISTAWSGYQAALWTGHQSELYGQASKLRVQAEGTATYANQERLYNASTVVEWLKAEAHGDKKLADLFERRLLPEFRPAFEAWKKTDPVNNPSAPPGPQLMAEYRSSKTEEAGKLNDQGIRGRHPRPATLRQIRASNGDAGNRAAADGDQPAFQDSRYPTRTASDRHSPAVLSGLPCPYPAASVNHSDIKRRALETCRAVANRHRNFLASMACPEPALTRTKF